MVHSVDSFTLSFQKSMLSRCRSVHNSRQPDWISRREVRGRKYGDLYRVWEPVLLGAGGHRAICVIHTDPIPCPKFRLRLHSPAWSELRNISSPPPSLDAVEEDDVSLTKAGITWLHHGHKYAIITIYVRKWIEFMKIWLMEERRREKETLLFTSHVKGETGSKYNTVETASRVTCF